MEEFLYYLLWLAERVAQPTLPNLMRSYGGPLDRKVFNRRISRMEQRKLLSLRNVPSRHSKRPERVVRLTEEGRLQALGGRNPAARWSRSWDGKWRVVAFDIPNARTALRDKLRRHFREADFGCIQKSVWISPDPLHDVKALLADTHVDAHSLLFWEGRPGAGETDRDIVNAAWDFAAIKRGYESYLNVLNEYPESTVSSSELGPSGLSWLAREHAAWLAAVAPDPLLPAPLLPPGYLGRNAWQARLKQFGRQKKASH